MKSYLLFTVLCIATMSGAYAETDALSMAINNSKSACTGISDKLYDIKKIAAINTALMGTGTIVGTLGVAVNIKKSKLDKNASNLETELKALETYKSKQSLTPVSFGPEFEKKINAYITSLGNELKDKNTQEMELILSKKQIKNQSDLDENNKKSHSTGNIRTAMMTANTATSIASTVVSVADKTDIDAKEAIQKCIKTIDALKSAKLQARLTDETDANSQMQTAQNIIDTCGKYNISDIDKIRKKTKGSTISGAIGIITGGTGTITSAIANKDKIGDEKKSNNLNKATTILGIGATGSSLVGTIFNATLISTANKIIETANACEGALK